jgi:hypothetical protein
MLAVNWSDARTTKTMRAAVMRPSVVAIGLGLAAGLTATLGPAAG